MPVAERTYAQALFGAAREQGRLAEVREELADFIAAARDVPELDALLRNPELDRHVKAAALRDLLAGAEELARNFVMLLVEKGRGLQLDEYYDEYVRLVDCE